MNPFITDLDEDQQQKLVDAGYQFVAMSWGASIWRHPDQPRSYRSEEALRLVEDSE